MSSVFLVAMSRRLSSFILPCGIGNLTNLLLSSLAICKYLLGYPVNLHVSENQLVFLQHCHNCQFLKPLCMCYRCGKTTVCQVYAELRRQALHLLNCHLHTESADFLGGLRPVRQHTDEKQVCICWRGRKWFVPKLTLTRALVAYRNHIKVTCKRIRFMPYEVIKWAC